MSSSNDAQITPPSQTGEELRQILKQHNLNVTDELTNKAISAITAHIDARFQKALPPEYGGDGINGVSNKAVDGWNAAVAEARRRWEEFGKD